MTYIKNIVRTLFIKDIKTPLGRWAIDYCTNTINSKVDLSNEDNCGSCGQYISKKKELMHNEKMHNEKMKKRIMK